MEERKTILVLRLEGPLQSWGENAKWDFRDSSTMPTKSGIVGLLGCAMGQERGSQVLVELAQSITVAIRADRPGAKFVDFQTVQGKPLKTADGGKRSNNTILSPHAYLQDACFTVFIDTTPEWQQRIISALENPRWCMYLGRKNCVPSRPILADRMEAADLMEALKEYPPAERAGKTMTYECEHPDSTAASIQRPDDLIGTNRQFQLRRVWRGSVERKEEQDVSD
ncbi:MAG: type I-E CRISPR-associated protein Cas5/CasD [Oscillospiraceae bacterium]|nr:type I-E CRISPR-associated protein Cas5/CasD [Oscillospiraceae bacterium]MBQ7129740.1 type I-E CRISPR-associated protein Cas5/CasD [Oscillospiraceae bacterium]